MKFAARLCLWIEPILLTIMVGAFWFPEPSRVNFLLLLLPSIFGRLILYRRLWVSTPLNVLLYGFLALCAVNTYIALADPIAPPYSWGWYMIGRPLMGALLVFSLISRIYEDGRIDRLTLIIILVAVLVGALGLASAQYTNKSNQLQFLLQFIPRWNSFPGAEGGFNVNEIGGGMAYFAPLAAGIAIYAWRFRGALTIPMRVLRVASPLAFFLLVLALFLGQSRLAIVGTVVALFAFAFLLIPAGRWRMITIVLLVLFSVLEALIVARIFEPPSSADQMIARDEDSFEVRFQIWNSALGIIRDYPFTGVGLNMFRYQQVREMYPAPGYAASVLPHAHNEILQVGSDTGIPGVIFFVSWHVALAFMVWRTWRNGDPFLRTVSISAAAGLLSHAIFGLADAITLFDRFIFAYWLLVALIGGAYVLSRRQPDEVPVLAEVEAIPLPAN
jgi:O-antigen ligase